MSCIILDCKSHSSRKVNQVEIVSFHRFPTDNAMRQKWINAIARTNWQWKKQHRICSRHFTNDCFINTDHKWRRLKSNAVPTLHLRSEMNVVASKSTNFHVVPTSSLISRPSVHHIYLTSQISNLQKENERLKKVAKQRLLKINSLRQKTIRLRKKYIDLKQLRTPDPLEVPMISR